MIPKRKVMNRKFIKMFLLVAYLVPGSLWAVKGVNFQDYALPEESSIKTKLETIRMTPGRRSVSFSDGHDTGNLKTTNATFLEKIESDPTWKKFDSFHWLVGGLTTARGNTKFVVKGANHPAGEKIFKPNDPFILPQIHTSTQNISRIKKSDEVNNIIKEKSFDNIRTPQTWMYPVSGNDATLKKDDLTDQDVIIVEEMIHKKSEDMTPLGPNDSCQTDALQIDQSTYDQLVTVAQEAKLLDLHPKNFLVDDQGKIVLMDLEDIAASQREAVENSNIIFRQWKKYKLNRFVDGSVKVGVGMTGISNQHDGVKHQGTKVLLHGLFTSLITRNIFEIAGVAAASTLTIRRIYHVRKTNKRIKHCQEKISHAIELEKAKENTISDSTCIEIAKKIVNQVTPKETRREIFEAFTTIALAKIAGESGCSGNIKLLSVEYNSPEDAERKSLRTINSIWRSDWSIPYKIARGAKATFSGIKTIGRKMSNLLSSKANSDQAVVAA